MDVPELRAVFLRHFGSEPTHRVQAPGRVGLLGEELEPHGLPTLSAALPRKVRMLLRPSDDEVVRVAAARGDGAAVSFEVGVDAGLHPESGPTKPLADVVGLMARRFGVRRGFDAVLSVEVPPGLGRVEALRVAGALACTDLGGVALPREELAALLGEGSEGPGPQAHACILGARRGHLVALSQDPLRIRPLLLPPDWRFVVARIPSAVTDQAPAWVPHRRVECRDALERLGDRLATRGRMPEASWSWSAVFRALGGPDRARAVGEEELDGALRKRFRHLATETERVERGEDAALLADLMEFGGLMDACHGSLRRDFLVSSAALDAAAAAALEGGAAGAHLTGRGGWIVALADTGTVHGVLTALREGGRGRPPAAGEAFVAEAEAGASFAPLEP